MPEFDLNIIWSGISPAIFGALSSIWTVFSFVWWIALPLALFHILFDMRMNSIKGQYIKSIKWTMLELRIPKENLKSPKSMEQVFSALHTMYSFGISGVDKYLKGKVEPWMSFELVGNSGGIYFYIKVPTDYKNLVEAAIFAQYADAEISEVADYVDEFPAILPNKSWDLWGTDMILAKDEPYPIKTYEYFEEKDKEKRLDTLSAITEVMAKLKGDDKVWIQIVIKPTGSATNKYKEKGQEIIDKMLGKETKKSAVKMTGLDHAKQFGKNLAMAPTTPPVWGAAVEAKKEDKPPKSVGSLPVSEQDVVKGIEGKINKICFEAVVRFILVGRDQALDKSLIAPIMGAFKQYNIEHLNSFKPNGDTTTSKGGWVAHLFPKYKSNFEYNRKRSMWDRYKGRVAGPKMSIMSVEELATIYHIPTAMVGTPKLRRLEAKKSEPPEGLPIEIEE